jgi:hypothetical protein
MNKTLIAAALAIGVGAAGAALTTVPAQAAFGISFNVGDVDLAYSDGYYDHDHHWHAWRPGEGDWYRSHYHSKWHDFHHDDHGHDHDDHGHDHDHDHDHDH